MNNLANDFVLYECQDPPGKFIVEIMLNKKNYSLEFRMLLQYTLLLIIFQEVRTHVFYNPNAHEILTSSSSSRSSNGYKLLLPPGRRRSPSFMRDQNQMGQCSDPGFTCTEPYDNSKTYQFQCSHDYQCPKSYKCCSHHCFLHKICVKAVTPNSNKRTDFQRGGTCDKWPYNCFTPYHYSLTSMFKCESDKQCPEAFKCCTQSCFQHKICTRVITSDIGHVEELRKKEDTGIISNTKDSERNETSISTTRIVITTEVEEETTEDTSTSETHTKPNDVETTSEATTERTLSETGITENNEAETSETATNSESIKTDLFTIETTSTSEGSKYTAELTTKVTPVKPQRRSR
ncbi:hypothetical protein JTB14_037948 [Gonioctena quinquepunctata]|nr:hypothetical protein JTB14_037948 [Gonioctena quinquepunctata]